MSAVAPPAPPRRQVSAIERLMSLPALFRGADLTVRFRWTSKTASQYLYLWRQRGLVQPLGGHSDVHANLLKDPVPDWQRAVLMAMPSAVVVGVEALRCVGWTTQIQRRPDIAVNGTHRIFGIDPFVALPRTPEWFEAVRPGIRRGPPDTLPVLRPAWALADMLQTQGWGKCGLWPDDVYWDEAGEQDRDDWRLAAAAMGVPAAARQDVEQGLAHRRFGECRTTVIPAVTADFCPACGESITDKAETERVMREMRAFDGRENAAHP